MSTATAYPLGGDYVEALHNTRVCFKDPALAGGEVALNMLGLPKAISGNFASVFTVDGTDGRRWAVKCFTRYVPDQDLRYQAISQALSKVRSSWRVGFQYLPEGILCKGQWYPAVKMEWIEATSLIPYLERHLGDGAALADLAGKFAAVVADLGRHGLGHGDLQHGNLLVTPSGELKLIDYDGMYVPSLAALGPSESGLANYQSPLRNDSTWGPDVDRFSSWVIYASLAAVAIDPSLWAALHRDGDEALLFKRADFLDRDGSAARTALLSSANPRLSAIARDIDFLWSGDLADVPPLASPLAGQPARKVRAGSPSRPARGGPSARRSARRSARNVPAGSPSRPAGGGLPEWMRQADGAPSQGSPQPAGVSWISTHLPPSPAAELTRPSRRLRAAFGALLACVVALCVATGVSPALVAAAEAAGALVALGAAVGVSVVPYRSLPAVQDRRRAKAGVAARKAALRDALAQVRAQEARVQRLQRQELDERGKAEKKAAKARAKEQSQLDAVSEKTHRAILAVERQLDQLRHRESSESQRARIAARREHVGLTMRQSLVADASVYGIGPGLTERLAAQGIRTAADVRAARSLTSVPGIGEKRQAELLAWAERVQALARVSATSAPLPAEQATAIDRKYGKLRDALVAKRSAADADGERALAKVRDRWAAVHAGSAREVAALTARFSQRRQDQEASLARARATAGAAAGHLESAVRELRRYDAIRYRNHLRRVITG